MTRGEFAQILRAVGKEYADEAPMDGDHLEGFPDGPIDEAVAKDLFEDLALAVENGLGAEFFGGRN